jgi:chemotaxis protein CheC
MSDKAFFSAEETDVLQELMNIAFGQAAAELAEVIDVSVMLSFPKLETVSVQKLPSAISENTNKLLKFNIIEQAYKGASNGVAYLIFPYGTEREFISLFHMDESETDGMFIDIQREVLSEVGNILIGACVSKIFDLLKTPVVYTPPHTSIGLKFEESVFKGRFKGEDFAIMLETSFCLSEKCVQGYLFLVNCEESVAPLKKALAEFMESYQ